MEDNPAVQQETPEQQGVRNQTDIDIILCMRRAVIQTFSTMCHINLKEKPKIEVRPIVRWKGKMRVIRPAQTAFVSVITLRQSDLKRKKYEVNGIIVVYFPESSIDELMPTLGLGTQFDEDDIKDACGEFLNVMAGCFKADLVKAGYDELDISTPHNFGFHVDELFEYYQDHKFEMVFLKESFEFFVLDIGLDKSNVKKSVKAT